MTGGRNYTPRTVDRHRSLASSNSNSTPVLTSQLDWKTRAVLAYQRDLNICNRCLMGDLKSHLDAGDTAFRLDEIIDRARRNEEALKRLGVKV